MQKSNMLTARKITTLKRAGRYGDGGGLWLQIKKGGTKSWLVRYMRKGRARHMGIGTLDLVPLAIARGIAIDVRRSLQAGIDPIEARRADAMKGKVEAAAGLTFRQCAEKYITAHEPTWRNASHRAQWPTSLANYVYPVLGDLPIAAIDVPLVLKSIEPIWHTKTDTAKRVRGRIEVILDWARARGYRHGENPARWKGHLDKILPAPSAVREVKHHPAVPYTDIAAFMGELRARLGVSARALEFTVLTALRTDAIINAQWSEIDFLTKTWTVPGTRMKRRRGQTSRPHVVPLSSRAIEILSAMPRENGGEFIFMGSRAGKPLSNMAMLELMRDMKPGFVPHGFRSTFKDWATEKTNYPEIVAEMALGHGVADKVEKAYRRGDLFEKRKRLMADWARYCAKAENAKTAVVIPLRRALPTT